VASRAEFDPPKDRAILAGEPDYPAELFELSDPPARLHVRGRWPLAAPRVAMVGSRAATGYGLRFAERLAADLASLGLVVVSGLAHGIDAAAHRGALAAGGTTCAVLPGSLDRIVPIAHVPLAREIARGGALVSERAAGAGTWASSFLERNRLIAALGQAVVVVEAAERSGALNTAAHARRLGRPLLAVPGDVDRATSRGCHALLRSGARVCEGAADVCAVLGGPIPVHAGSGRESGASDPVARLLELLEGPATVEACAQAAGWSLEETLQQLLRLEWAGLVASGPGARWCRREARA
jgi:DNA processing protein